MPLLLWLSRQKYLLFESLAAPYYVTSCGFCPLLVGACPRLCMIYFDMESHFRDNNNSRPLHQTLREHYLVRDVTPINLNNHLALVLVLYYQNCLQKNI